MDFLRKLILEQYEKLVKEKGEEYIITVFTIASSLRDLGVNVLDSESVKLLNKLKELLYDALFGRQLNMDEETRIIEEMNKPGRKRVTEVLAEMGITL